MSSFVLCAFALCATLLGLWILAMSANLVLGAMTLRLIADVGVFSVGAFGVATLYGTLRRRHETQPVALSGPRQ